MAMPRPDMRPYFRARIDQCVNGMMARSSATAPQNVSRVVGNVTDHEIIVVMFDGTRYRWTGGKYATRKINGCYAPLMPKPID